MNWISSFTDAERWAAGLIVFLFLALAAHRLSLWRERHSRLVAASANFRAAFNNALLNFQPDGAATSVIVNQFHLSHLAAIETFRSHLPWRHRKDFDRAVRHYGEQADYYRNQDILAQFATEQTADAQERRAALLSAIRQILFYANNT